MTTAGDSTAPALPPATVGAGGLPHGAARRRSLRLNVLAGTLSNVLRGGLAFGTSLVVTRALTTEGRGTYSFITNTVTLLVMLAGIGIPAAMTRERAKHSTEAVVLYRSAALLGMVGGALAGGLFWLGYAWGPNELFTGVGTGAALAVVGLTPVLLVLSHWTVVAYLDDRVVEFACAGIAGASLLLGSVLVLAVGPGLTSSSAVAAWGITSALPLLLLLRPSRVRGAWRTRATAVRMVRFGLRANVAVIALILAWRVDIYFVKGLRGLSELGLYAVAVGMGEILVMVALSLRVALLPLQGSSEDRPRLVASISGLTRLTFAAGTVAAAALALIAPWLVVLLYGSRYAQSADALQWLLPGIVFLVVQGPLIDYLLTEGKVKGVTIFTSSALLVNVGLNLALLPRFGFVVAAASSTAAYAMSCLGCLWLFRRCTDVSWRDLAITRREDVARVVPRRRRPREGP